MEFIQTKGLLSPNEPGAGCQDDTEDHGLTWCAALESGEGHKEEELWMSGRPLEHQKWSVGAVWGLMFDAGTLLYSLTPVEWGHAMAWGGGFFSQAGKVHGPWRPEVKASLNVPETSPLTIPGRGLTG